MQWSDELGWVPLYDPLSTSQQLDLAFVITPEPMTMVLLSLGGLTLLRRRGPALRSP